MIELAFAAAAFILCFGFARDFLGFVEAPPPPHPKLHQFRARA